MPRIEKTRGIPGKFLEQILEAGRRKMPDKMKNYRRKSLYGGKKKGRRDYPWRKQKK